jgi:RHS repeat-associated protein
MNMTDSSGNIVNKYAYDAFGNVLHSEEATPNPFKYVGMAGAMDEGNGLLYMRARYYDPGLGRFINQDPIGLLGGINVYEYVGNNPLNFVDPSGLQSPYQFDLSPVKLPERPGATFGEPSRPPHYVRLSDIPIGGSWTEDGKIIFPRDWGLLRRLSWRLRIRIRSLLRPPIRLTRAPLCPASGPAGSHGPLVPSYSN